MKEEVKDQLKQLIQERKIKKSKLLKYNTYKRKFKTKDEIIIDNAIKIIEDKLDYLL